MQNAIIWFAILMLAALLRWTCTSGEAKRIEQERKRLNRIYKGMPR